MSKRTSLKYIRIERTGPHNRLCNAMWTGSGLAHFATNESVKFTSLASLLCVLKSLNVSFSERAKCEATSLRAGSIASLRPFPTQGMVRGRRADVSCPPHLGDEAWVTRVVKRLYECAVRVAV